MGAEVPKGRQGLRVGWGPERNRRGAGRCSAGWVPREEVLRGRVLREKDSERGGSDGGWVLRRGRVLKGVSSEEGCVLRGLVLKGDKGSKRKAVPEGRKASH